MEIIQVGAFRVNCGVLFSDSGCALVVDPGFDSARILQTLKAQPTDVCGYLLTHSHPDHLSALNDLYQCCPAPVYIHAADEERAFSRRSRIPPHYGQPARPDADFVHPETAAHWTVGGLRFHCLETPGHTPGGVCYWFDQDAVCFAGDLLVKGGASRSSRKLGDQAALADSLRRLAQLPPQTLLVPGHGECTTVEEELAANPLLREAIYGR